jgi:hypothetical protein
MLSKTERETGGGASTGSERRMTSEMEQKRRGEGVEGEGAAVRLRRSPGELVGDGAARPMATEVGRAGWEEEEKSGYDYVARLRGLCRGTVLPVGDSPAHLLTVATNSHRHQSGQNTPRSFLLLHKKEYFRAIFLRISISFFLINFFCTIKICYSINAQYKYQQEIIKC